MKARFINEQKTIDIAFLVDQIFFIWDEFEDDREGIEGFWITDDDRSKAYNFLFKEEYHPDFKTEVDLFLKDFRIEHFEKIEPFEWNWDENNLTIKLL